MHDRCTAVNIQWSKEANEETKQNSGYWDSTERVLPHQTTYTVGWSD